MECFWLISHVAMKVVIGVSETVPASSGGWIYYLWLWFVAFLNGMNVLKYKEELLDYVVLVALQLCVWMFLCGMWNVLYVVKLVLGRDQRLKNVFGV
jgi:hypothetical protein